MSYKTIPAALMDPQLRVVHESGIEEIVPLNSERARELLAQRAAKKPSSPIGPEGIPGVTEAVLPLGDCVERIKEAINAALTPPDIKLTATTNQKSNSSSTEGGRMKSGEQLLGHAVEDRITGFKGIATGFVKYISGCNQFLVAGKVKSDGSAGASEWFDEQRLEVLSAQPEIQLNNEQHPGHDRPAPKR